ncbi:MAG: SCO family protein [Rhodospirillales bacterium]|nr:SCO family protein [Rhodospirillales bacterium]
MFKFQRNLLGWLAIIGVALVPTPGREALGADAPSISGRFLLKDDKGQVVTDQSYSGKIRVMTFGYTFCPDICPTTLSTMSEAATKLAAHKDKIVYLFVSVDPERDSAEQLRTYLESFPGIRGLTGSPALIEGAARNFRVVYERQPAPKDDPQSYAVDHTAGIYIMGGDGRFLSKLPHIAQPEDVVSRIKGFLKP